MNNPTWGYTAFTPRKMSDVPSGFVLDQPSNNDLPPGFVLDQPQHAVYEVSAPNGQKFRVTAPHGASQADVLTYAKANAGGNVFDQFDAPPSQSGNPFDQFDAPGRRMTLAQQQAIALGSARARAAEAEAGPSWSDIGTDVAKSAGVGVGKGVIGLAGLPGDLTDYGAKGIKAASDYISDKIGVARYEPKGQSVLNNIPTNASLTKNVEGVTGEFYKPQTTAGKYAETVGEFVPGAALGGAGGVTRKMLAQALFPGVASEAAGQATEGTQAEPWARAGAAIVGSMVPGSLSRIANPLRPSAERTAAASVLRNEGVPVTAGQVTGSSVIKALESPFGGNTEGQLRALTEAAMRRTGEKGGIATRENVARMEARIGQQFDDLAARNRATLDQPFATDMQNALQNYARLVDPPSRTPAVQHYAQEIYAKAQKTGGVLPGDEYQSLRSRMGKDANSITNPEAKFALRDLQDALDGAMERSIGKSNPSDLGKWQKVRQEYRNSLVIKDAAVGGGENAPLGLLTPGQLSSAVTRLQGKKNRAVGKGDFSELSDAASGLLTALPNSGTPARAVPQIIASTLGAALGGATSGGLGAGVGALLGPLATGLAVRNPLTQAYLSGRLPGQRMLAKPTSTVTKDALRQALLQGAMNAR